MPTSRINGFPIVAEEFDITNSQVFRQGEYIALTEFVDGLPTSGVGGNFEFPDGSASTPALANQGDTNTGLYWGAADTLDVATAGVRRFEVGPLGTFGFNFAAEAVSASTIRIDQPTGDTGSDTRVSIANTAGNRAALTQTNASDHVTLAMGASGVATLGNRWGIGMSGSGEYAIIVEHGGYPSTYHKNFGVHVNATSARHPLTVGESEAPATTGQMVGVYKAGAAYQTIRNTTDNVEAILGAAVGAVFFGSATAHSIVFRVADIDKIQFNGSVLEPVSAGTVGVGSTTLPFGDLSTQGSTFEKEVSLAVSNGANNDVTLPIGTFFLITAPTGAFSISGFASPVNGRRITIYNGTTQNMTITNDATSTAANRILTLTGADVALTGTSVAEFRYSAVASRWILCGTQG